MATGRKIFRATVLCLFFGLCSCGIDPLDTACCDNVHLTFRYFPTPDVEQYNVIGSQTHLLFRDGVLSGKLQVNGGIHGEGLLAGNPEAQSLRHLVYTLPKGRYTLYSWSNYTEGTSLLADAGDGSSGYAALRVGQTRREDIRLRMIKPSADNNGQLSGSERLYYGYCDFTFDGTQRVHRTVDMLNAHLQLQVTVVWANPARDVTARGATLQNVRMRLGDLPAGYLQENIHAESGDVLTLGFDADRPLYGDRRITEHVPEADGQTGKISVTMSQTESTKVWGSLVSYRLLDDTHPVLSLWAQDNATRLMKDVDLHRFFEIQGWARTRNLRQDYRILITIDGDRVEIAPLDNIGWIDGGVIGAGS